MKSLTKIIIISVVGVVASLLLVTIFVRPVISAVTKLNADVKSKRSELALLEQQILAFKTAQSSLSKATRSPEIADAIVVKENLVEAVKDLESAVNKTASNNEILKIIDPNADSKPTDQKPLTLLAGEKGVQEIPYRLTTSNDYVGLINLLSYLEHLPHFTEIGKINLSAEVNGGNGSSVVHTGQVLGNFDGVFFIKNP